MPEVPKRIISVVPSQTELLFYLGLDVEVVGITKFCIHPADKFKTVTKVGGTKQLEIDQIRALNPDLVIANKEENTQLQIEELMNICPVWISDVHNFDDALEMIRSIGTITNRRTEANILLADITTSFNKLILQALNQRVVYFIWRKPYMAAGPNTFISSMLQKCGLINAVKASRYPEISAQELTEINPDLIFLSSEPYPFKQKHADELQELLPSSQIILVNGELFSWYGSRLLDAPAYFRQLINNLTIN